MKSRKIRKHIKVSLMSKCNIYIYIEVPNFTTTATELFDLQDT